MNTPTPTPRDVIIAAKKWIMRLIDRKDQIPVTFFDNIDPSPLVSELNKVAKRYEELERETASLRAALEAILPIAEFGMPMPSHLGLCGPESGCDASCMDHAHCCERIEKAHALLKSLTPEPAQGGETL